MQQHLTHLKNPPMFLQQICCSVSEEGMQGYADLHPGSNCIMHMGTNAGYHLFWFTMFAPLRRADITGWTLAGHAGNSICSSSTAARVMPWKKPAAAT